MQAVKKRGFQQQTWRVVVVARTGREKEGRAAPCVGRELDGRLVYIAKSSIVGRLAEMCRKLDLLMRCLDATRRGAMLNASRGWKSRRAGLAEGALPGLPFGGELK